MRILHTFSAEGFTSSMYERDDGSCFLDHADADIDADGSPHAYHKGNTGTDDLRNALDADGRYVGILTGKDGVPLIQGDDDAAPGYYISTTAYQFLDRPRYSQSRYLDGEAIPFIVLPPVAIQSVNGIVLGCRAIVTHLHTGKTADGLVGDIGPRAKVGEISPAMARALGISADPRRGVEDRPLLRYEWWPGQIWLPAFPLQPAR